MKASAQLAFANVRLIVPAMMLWIAVKLLLLFLISRFTVLPYDSYHRFKYVK